MSTDGGQTWTTIVDSPKLNTITSVFSDPSSKFAYVATYSRGLWRLNMVPPGYKELLTYVGARTGPQGLPAKLAATFINNSRTPPLPIANAWINFQIGSGPICAVLTDATGKAQCNVTPYLPQGTYTLTTRFAGDAQYTPTQSARPFMYSIERPPRPVETLLRGFEPLLCKPEAIQKRAWSLRISMDIPQPELRRARLA